jgi:hypothetical protein
VSRTGDIGDGDTCPLFPQHGNMFTIPGDVPKQYCAHIIHDGRKDVPATRSIWPLYGLDDTVHTYLKRLEKAVAQSDLPDLSDVTLEV